MKIMFVIAFLSIISITYSKDHSKVKMRDVEALLFQKDHMTTGRRSSPVKQMVCKGYPCLTRAPESISCKNIGWDGKDPTWDCTTSSMKDTKLKRIEVQCEGYEYPDDPYILVGSCSVIYHLSYTEKPVHVPNLSHTGDRNNDEPSPLTGLIILFMIGICLCSCSDDDVRGRNNSYGDSFMTGAAVGYMASSFGSGSPSYGRDTRSWSSSSAFGSTSRR